MRDPGFLLFARTDTLPHSALSAWLQSHRWTSASLFSMREAARTSHALSHFSREVMHHLPRGTDAFRALSGQNKY